MRMSKIILLLFVLSSCSSLKDPSFIEVLNNVQHDMKVDSIKYFTHGLTFVPPVFSKEIRDTMSMASIKKYDSLYSVHKKIELKHDFQKNILKKYGLYEFNLGCVIDKQTSILSKKYKNETKTYLEKRNGIGWEEKMEKEFNEL